MSTVAIERKVVSISPKRQITIPQKFFTKLNFGTEAECLLRGSEIVIRPANYSLNEEFSELILADLIKEGYEGAALLKEFQIRKHSIRPAVEAMIEEADAAANGLSESYSIDEVF